MAHRVIMPKAGMAMETGTVVRWLKAVGDRVATGEAILEIETDKVVMEVEAEASGTLLAILHDEGDEVPVTEVIGFIGEPGELIGEPLPTEFSAPARGLRPAAAQEAEPRPKTAPEPVVKHSARPDGAARTGASSGAADVSPSSAVVRATPAARRKAMVLGVALPTVHPTGPAGEVRSADVERAAGSRPAAGAARDEAPPQESLAPEAQGSPTGAAAPLDFVVGSREPLRPIRRAIVRAMTTSQQVPQYTLYAEADVAAVVRRREGRGPGQPPPTVTSFVVQAVALAYRDVPEAAVIYGEDELIRIDDPGIGLAVSVPGGILVPVIRGAGSMKLDELDRVVRELGASARSGTIAGTGTDDGPVVTTVSNLGMFGVHHFAPMLTPPQSTALGVGTIRTVPAITDGALVERPVISLGLTADHRAVDGAEAARLLQAVVRRLEGRADGA